MFRISITANTPRNSAHIFKMMRPFTQTICRMIKCMGVYLYARLRAHMCGLHATGNGYQWAFNWILNLITFREVAVFVQYTYWRNANNHLCNSSLFSGIKCYEDPYDWTNFPKYLLNENHWESKLANLLKSIKIDISQDEIKRIEIKLTFSIEIIDAFHSILCFELSIEHINFTKNWCSKSSSLNW